MKPFETGLTGPDWEPTAETKYYAVWGTEFDFGPTPWDAVAALMLRTTDKEGLKDWLTAHWPKEWTA